ncbi:MAG TPA: DUF4304 domain-containing protein [Tepidisphaeraceae bacterium]|jgi:hypothetical protein
MSTPVAYQWTFDRTPFGDHDEFSTFSVGVYQWVPKSSGKGLKKSKTIRVVGYVVEPDKVYERAEQLCRQLNESGARSDALPDWVQKQYSVPKPAGMVIPRRSNDLAGQQVRSLRLQIMEEELLPLGFVKGRDATYVRRRGDQIHLIDFQAHRYGHEFTVNLGFHYLFIPPAYKDKPISLSEVHLLDYRVHERIGRFLPGGLDHWFRYGADRAALRGTLQRCAAESLLVLDEHGARWRDPANFYELLSGDRHGIWHCSRRHLTLGCVAMRLGRLDEAEQHFQDWSTTFFYPGEKLLFERLMNSLRGFRERPSLAMECGTVWITA